MALATVTTINTTNIDLASDMTSGLFTSNALTLSDSYLGLQITWADVVGGYPTIWIRVSNDDTDYVDIERPEEFGYIPIKYTIREESGSYSLPIDGLDFGYAKVLVVANGATAGTIVIDANH